jgi:hypothetical protein
MRKIEVASEIPVGNTEAMEVLIAFLLLVLLALCAANWAVDSRPVDAERPTRWWPATPRN